MAYSRWLGSAWYTFWSVGGGDDINSQIFDICADMSFTYGEFKRDGINGCIKRLKAKHKTDGSKYTDEDYTELVGYMRRFMKDVEDKYKTPSQKYRDGEITLEEAFIGEI